MTPGEVAALFRVDPKTVTKWARAGKLSCIRTLGGHRRYKTAEIRALLATSQIPKQAADGPDLDDVARQCPRRHAPATTPDPAQPSAAPASPPLPLWHTPLCDLDPS
jgi:excisionase family DNA binding protein